MTDGTKPESTEPESFEALGYAVIEGFLDGSAVAALRHEVELALQAPPMLGCERPHNRLAALRWDDPIVSIVLADEARRDAVRQRIGGNDLRWISGYVTSKDPHSAPLWWHQDWWCWDHPVSFRRVAPQVALLCYLSDTSSDTGALRLLPGSHHRSAPLHDLLPSAHAHGEALALSHPAMLDQSGQETLSLSAGDAVVLDYRLLHGTHPNDSDDRRDCVLLSLTPSWRELPADLRAHLVQHLALPTVEERTAAEACLPGLLPSFGGVPADLPVNVCAPTQFAAAAACVL